MNKAYSRELASVKESDFRSTCGAALFAIYTAFPLKEGPEA
jgi:hypothetical protein